MTDLDPGLILVQSKGAYMLNIPGTYEGMSSDEYVDILEQYVIYLEDLLSPVAGMLKVIMPLDVELEDDEEVH